MVPSSALSLALSNSSYGGWVARTSELQAALNFSPGSSDSCNTKDPRALCKGA